MRIKFKKLRPDAKTPHQTHKGDAGFDLFCAEDIVIKSGGRFAVPTGIAIMIPLGFVGLIWDKGGRAFKDGLKTMAGVVDSCYRGEVLVVVFNTSNKDVAIKKSEKIAQMLIQKTEDVDFEEVDDLDSTSRGGGRFGSTGLN